MSMKATVTSKGQITIPLEVRQRLGLKQGDRVAFSVENGLTILKPDRGESNPFEKYAGSLGSLKTKEEVKAWLNDLRDDE
jgi:antitoxin PrlF